MLFKDKGDAQAAGVMVPVTLAVAYLTFGCLWPWMGHQPPWEPLFRKAEATSHAWEKAEPLLIEARRKAHDARDARLGALQAWFVKRADGCRGFADEALSFGAKWFLVQNAASGDGSHARFLSDAFARHVFSPEDMTAEMERTVTGYLADLDAIHNDLLVRLRADLADAPLPGGGRLSADALEGEVNRLAAELAPTIAADLGVNAAAGVAGAVGPGAAAAACASAMIQRLSAALAAEMGVPVAFAGSGVVAGGFGLAVTLAVAVVVDRIIAQVLAALGHDPEGQVAEEARKCVLRASDRIRDGNKEAVQAFWSLRWRAKSDGTGWVRDACRDAARALERGGHIGLREELDRLQDAREDALWAALRALLTKGGGR